MNSEFVQEMNKNAIDIMFLFLMHEGKFDDIN